MKEADLTKKVGVWVNHVKHYPSERNSVEFWAVRSASRCFSIPKQDERFLFSTQAWKSCTVSNACANPCVKSNLN